MKLEHLYEQLITEIGGLSSQSRGWANVIKDILKDEKGKEKIIYGRDYPELYQQFPVDVFYIQNTPGYGAYDENNSGYDKNGVYVVWLYMPFENANDALSHELRHAFEDYNRISKGKPRISQTKETQDFYNADFVKLLTGKIPGYFDPFRQILTALYTTSKLEESAYTDTVVDTDLPILFRLQKILKRDYLNPRDLKNDKDVRKRWEKLKTLVDIPILNRFDDYMDFIKWADAHIQKRAWNMYKKLLKVKYLHNMETKKGVK